MKKASRAIMFILLLVVICIGVLFIMSTTKINSITIEGNSHISKEQICNIVGFNETSSILYVLTHRVNVIKNVSYVSKLEVEYIGLKDVHIQVYEKEIIGYVDYMGKFLCLDGNGYIIDYTDQTDVTKPKIKGLNLTDFTMDKALDVPKEIAYSIDTIYRNAVAFGVSLHWIDFTNGQGDNIQLQKGKILIIIGDVTQIEKKFQLIKEVLSVLPGDEEGVLNVEKVDGNIIFKSTKEKI